LTGGVYLLGDATRRTLHYTYLPNKDDVLKDGEIEWKGKEVRMEHMIIDMGLNVYENDLLAVITAYAVYICDSPYLFCLLMFIEDDLLTLSQQTKNGISSTFACISTKFQRDYLIPKLSNR
jgi:hypothetical protein